jgi:hypothetical protein
MPHTVPFSPIEGEILSLVATVGAAGSEWLLGSFEGRVDAAELERIVESFKRNGLVNVVRCSNIYAIEVTCDGARAAKEIDAAAR